MSYMNDSKGNKSSVRLGYVVWVLGVFAVWATLSALNHTLLEIPQTVVEIMLVIVLGKTAQKHVEEKS